MLFCGCRDAGAALRENLGNQESPEKMSLCKVSPRTSKGEKSGCGVFKYLEKLGVALAGAGKSGVENHVDNVYNLL